MVHGWKIEDGQFRDTLVRLDSCSTSGNGVYILCADMCQCLDCSNCPEPDDGILCVSSNDNDDSDID